MLLLELNRRSEGDDHTHYDRSYDTGVCVQKGSALQWDCVFDASSKQVAHAPPGALSGAVGAVLGKYSRPSYHSVLHIRRSSIGVFLFVRSPLICFG